MDVGSQCIRWYNFTTHSIASLTSSKWIKDHRWNRGNKIHSTQCANTLFHRLHACIFAFIIRGTDILFNGAINQQWLKDVWFLQHLSPYINPLDDICAIYFTSDISCPQTQHLLLVQSIFKTYTEQKQQVLEIQHHISATYLNCFVFDSNRLW